MELKALWQMFWRRWWLILLPVIVVGVLTAPDLLAAVRGDTSGGGSFSTVINLTAAQPPDSGGTTYEDSGYFPWVASEYVVNGLTDWVRTGSFAAEVSAGLAERGIETEAAAIHGSVSADNARSVMRLYLTWPDAEQLQAMTEVALDVLQSKNGEYFPQFAVEPARVIPLDDVVIAPVPPTLTNRFGPFLKLALGLAVGIALAAVLEYLDDSVRSRADLAGLAIPVLGEIPPYK